MKKFEFDYPWTKRTTWYLPDDELMMQGQFPILDEQINFVLDALTLSGKGIAPKTAVQAGGAFGMYPRRLADHFEKVYTFEPLIANLECLMANLPEDSIEHLVIVPNALWHQHEKLFMDYSKPVKNSYGAHHVSKHGNGEEVSGYPLDDWGLTDVDLIWLDIEGAEKHALRGAAATITQNMPVVVIEQHKNLPQHAKLGVSLEGASQWLLKNFDYKYLGRTHGDVVYIPR